MSLLTFGEFREIVAPYAGRGGKCPDAKEVSTFAKTVMQYMLIEGADAGIRKLSILAHRGCISLPPEVEVPIKARIDFSVAEVWNKWAEFHSGTDGFESCLPAGQILAEDGTFTPLAYPVPPGGSVVGVMGSCDEEGVVIVQGKDPTGREIYTTYGDEKIVGERFTIKKNTLQYGQIKFGEITGVTKPQTFGYVSLHAVDVAKQKITQFLADWSPSEEKPMYRRFRVIARECGPLVKVSMLARVRLKDNYSDNELTLFENRLTPMFAAQRIQSEANSDTNTASYKRDALKDMLNSEAEFKHAGGSSAVDVYHPLSGGAIRGIVSTRGWGARRI